MSQKVIIYPGTFDPLTYGHIDIIERGARLGDQLIVAVSLNLGKQPLFSIEERIAMVERETAHISEDNDVVIEVLSFDTLLMNFVEEIDASIIIRGLRAVSDFEYEFQMTAMNYQLNSDVETVFLMADPSLQAIASKLVKEIAHYDGDIRKFVTPTICDDVLRKLGKK